MKNILLFIILLMMTSLVFGQQKIVYVYDMQSGTLDSITNITFDPTITAETTDHYTGNYNNNIEQFAQTVPSTGVYPNTKFTYRRHVSDSFDLTNYPIRTTTKMFWIDEDTLKSIGSGNMISNQHLLTSVVNFIDYSGNRNEVVTDSVLVCPTYDNGVTNSSFQCSYVSKIYFFKDWTNGNAMAIAELSEPIGAETGWVGVGFNEDDSFFEQGVYYRFAYPDGYFPFLGATTVYNGDTLNYQYGHVDFTSPEFLGVKMVTGYPGESGSNLLHLENNVTYTSYGTLLYSGNLRHSRIVDWVFYSFKQIIEDNLTRVSEPDFQHTDIGIFPNPASQSFNFKGIENLKITGISMVDNLGRTVKKIAPSQAYQPIDTSSLSTGVYYVFVTTENGILGTKLVISY